MQPRVKSKMWANDTLVAANDVGEKQAIANKKGKNASVPEHTELVQKACDTSPSVDTELVQKSKDTPLPLDIELVKSGSLEHGFSNSHEYKKSHEVVHDEVISDMEYFKSRVTKEWSDSESSDDGEKEDNDSVSSDDDDNKDIYSIDADGEQNSDYKPSQGIDADGEQNSDDKPSQGIERSGAQNLNTEGHEDSHKDNCSHENAEERGPSDYSGDEVPEQGGPSSSLEDEKGVVESCRLFVRNLPYTAT